MNKSVILSLCTIFSLLVLVSSCSNKLDEPGFPGLRCDVNNIEYVADTAYYQRSLGTSIYAYTGNTVRMKFYLLRTTANTIGDSIGNYNLDSTTNIAYYTDGVTQYRSISGSMNISQYYNDSLGVITGSFNFIGRVPGSSGNAITISYGYFNNIPRH
jgi:hypothetical protein